MPYVEVKTNTIKNQQQQSFIPASIFINITSHPANTFGSTLSIYQLTIISGPAQIGLILPADLPQQPFNDSGNLYTHMPPIKVLNKMLLATIVAQFVKI